MTGLHTIAHAEGDLAARGVDMPPKWIKVKALCGAIPGAQKAGGKHRGCWLIPREWAETYARGKGGRPRKVNKDGGSS